MSNKALVCHINEIIADMLEIFVSNQQIMTTVNHKLAYKNAIYAVRDFFFNPSFHLGLVKFFAKAEAQGKYENGPNVWQINALDDLADDWIYHAKKLFDEVFRHHIHINWRAYTTNMLSTEESDITIEMYHEWDGQDKVFHEKLNAQEELSDNLLFKYSKKRMLTTF